MLDGEYKLLRKYVEGQDVSDTDISVLDDWASIGYVTYGYSLDRHCKTAKLTNLGKRWIKREEIARSPFKRFFYRWANSLF